MIKPVFPAGPLFLDKEYQPGASVAGQRVFYSPDDAPISSFYRYALVPNGEFILNVKYSGINMVTKDSSMIVLTNHKSYNVEKKLPKDKLERF